ncbi:MAG: FAD-dependent monooxygenase [Thermoleophilia bacterium]
MTPDRMDARGPAGAPVMVVGAGPVGLAAALMLARHGTPVRVIDANDGPTDLSKALVMWRRTLQVLDPVMPFEDLAHEHTDVRGASVRMAGGRRAEVPLRTPGAGIPAGVVVPQSHTERLLSGALGDRGVAVERRTRLSGFVRRADGVDCLLVSARGTERVRASWLIACDGAASGVRHGLGLTFPGARAGRRWMVADVDVEGGEDAGHALLVTQGAAGAVVLVPMGAGRWRVMADREGERTGGAPDPSPDDVQAVLDERTDLGLRVAGLRWGCELRADERQMRRYVHGRVVLAGDAAHAHGPVGAQGLNAGIQDAANLAWKIALVERGAAPESLVATYQAERHPIGAMVRRTSGLVLHAAVSGVLEEGAITYSEGPLSNRRGAGGAVRSGDAFPDVTVAMDGVPVSSQRLLRDAEATLVLLGDAGLGGAPARIGAGEGGIPVTVRRVGPGLDAEDTDGRLERALGLRRGAVLVRPDGVIATVGRRSTDAADWARDRLGATRAAATGRGRPVAAGRG